MTAREDDIVRGWRGQTVAAEMILRPVAGRALGLLLAALGGLAGAAGVRGGVGGAGGAEQGWGCSSKIAAAWLPGSVAASGCRHAPSCSFARATPR